MLIANIIALTLLLVFAIAVLTKKNKKLPDKFLLLIILFFMAYLLSDIWINYFLNRWSFAFHIIVSYLTFIPLFFYAMMLISRKHRLKKSWWFFVIFHEVFVAFLILDVFFLNDYSHEDIHRLYVDPPLAYHFFYKALCLFNAGTLIWFLSKLHKYQREIEDYYSNIDELRLDWLKYFLWIYIIISIASQLSFILFSYGLISDIKIPYLIISILLILSFLWLVFKGTLQHSLAIFTEPNSHILPSNPKYMTSSLSDEIADELYKMILELFEQEQIFHNPDLRVQHIAEKLGVTNHNISQVLNQKANKTFYELVNDYRIDYFKELLADPDKKRYTILALGLESGFNSKASLNRVFKQQIGKTPKEYQKQAVGS